MPPWNMVVSMRLSIMMMVTAIMTMRLTMMVMPMGGGGTVTPALLAFHDSLVSLCLKDSLRHVRDLLMRHLLMRHLFMRHLLGLLRPSPQLSVVS